MFPYVKSVLRTICFNTVIALPRYADTVQGTFCAELVYVVGFYATSRNKYMIWFMGNIDITNILPVDRINGTLG
jgi:hypothetical protein